MEVWSPAMGPERVLPNSEDELGGEERPGTLLPVWNGGEGNGEGEEGGETELDGEEEEEEEETNNEGGYYYQPLNQEPEGGHFLPPGQPGEEGEEEGDAPPSHTEQLQQVQQRIQVMGLHLPEAPPAESEDEEDAEGAAALRSRASIPMDEDHVELVKRTMAAVALPALVVPLWAREISEAQWKDMVENTLQSRQKIELPHRSGP